MDFLARVNICIGFIEFLDLSCFRNRVYSRLRVDRKGNVVVTFITEVRTVKISSVAHRRTTVDRMAGHRKLDRRRDDLCAGGLRRRAPDIFRNASARRRSRCSTRALNRGDSAVCESHFNATLPTACPRVIPFRDCSFSVGGLLTTYRRAYQGGDFLSCHSYL